LGIKKTAVVENGKQCHFQPKQGSQTADCRLLKGMMPTHPPKIGRAVSCKGKSAM